MSKLFLPLFLASVVCSTADAQIAKVYVANSGSGEISFSNQDLTTGALTTIGSVLAGIKPISLVAVPSVGMLYAADQASNSVLGFKIDPNTGNLTTPPSTTQVGSQPVFVTTTPLQNYLYVVNSGSNNISAFQISPTGSLAAISASPFPAGATPVQLATDGRNAWVINAGDKTIVTFDVNITTGALTQHGAPVLLEGQPSALVVSHTTPEHVYVSILDRNELEAFTYDPLVGILELIGKAPTGVAPSSLADTNGYLYAANAGSNSVSAFKAAADGTLTPTGTAQTGQVPVFVKPAPSAPFLNVANFGSNDITVDRINSNWTLTPVPGSFPTGFDPSSIDEVTVGALPPMLTKSFGSPTIALNGTTTLTFTVTNPNNFPLSGIAFSDPLAGTGLATLRVTANTCPDASVIANPLVFGVLVDSMTLGPNSSCTLTVEVLAAPAASGVITNTTSGVVSSALGRGNPATATITITPAPAHLVISAPSVVTAGTPFNFSVSAVDSNGNLVLNFNDRVHFTASDAKASLPQDITLNGGTGSFAATLKTAGPQSITVTDVSNPAMTVSANITVNPGPAVQLNVAGPATANAGSPVPFSVTASDAFGNPATIFSDLIDVTSTDPNAALPLDAPLTGGTGRLFITFNNVGSQTVTAKAKTNPAIFGISNPVIVSGGTSGVPGLIAFMPPGPINLLLNTTQNATILLPTSMTQPFTVNLTSTNDNVLTLPSSLLFPRGVTSMTFPITGTAAGSTFIRAFGPGASSNPISVTVRIIATIILPPTLSLGLGESAPLGVRLSVPAPAGGVTLTITASDPAVLDVSSATVFIPAGATAPAQQPSVTLRGLGSATITVSGPGFPPATELVRAVR